MVCYYDTNTVARKIVISFTCVYIHFQKVHLLCLILSNNSIPCLPVYALLVNALMYKESIGWGPCGGPKMHNYFQNAYKYYYRKKAEDKM